MKRKKISPLYRVIRWLVWAVYPKMRVSGAENLPEGACMIVGNHCQMHGPISSELYIPGHHYTWCAGQMMRLKEVPAYAYKDFWSQKPRFLRPVYKLLSYIIAPLSVCVFNNANTIAVYHDARTMATFKNTVAKLQENAAVVVFPEHYEAYNHILYAFQDKFIDIARLYFKRTGKELDFVPMYITPALKTIYFGKPIRYRAGEDAARERQRICQYLMEQITQIACGLPEHRVVPYPNVPKKDYPSNLAKETVYEKTSG